MLDNFTENGKQFYLPIPTLTQTEIPQLTEVQVQAEQDFIQLHGEESHRYARIDWYVEPSCSFTLPLPTVTVLEEANLKLTCVYIPTPNRHRA